MAKTCAEGGSQHVGGEVDDGPPYDVIVGRETVTYQRKACATCGAGLRNDIINRQRNDN
jgi:hypothetical protein